MGMWYTFLSPTSTGCLFWNKNKFEKLTKKQRGTIRSSLSTRLIDLYKIWTYIYQKIYVVAIFIIKISNDYSFIKLIFTPTKIPSLDLSIVICSVLTENTDIQKLLLLYQKDQIPKLLRNNLKLVSFTFCILNMSS